MKLAIRIETDIDEGLHENGVDDYSEAILDFCGGQESFSDGFEDEIYNYRQLIIFLGSNIIKEEKEAELKIDESWKNEQEDIRYEVSHVKSFRKFTLHALFVSIHSMYEGRLKEYCLILKQFNKANISLFKNDSVVVILGKIKKKARSHPPPHSRWLSLNDGLKRY